VVDLGRWLVSGGWYLGQGIFIDPARQLVIASNSNWTSADGNVDGEWEARNDFYRAVQRALDTEAAQ
jgi:CubicO group peptidase (beta-lactamase class C family)